MGNAEKCFRGREIKVHIHSPTVHTAYHAATAASCPGCVAYFGSQAPPGRVIRLPSSVDVLKSAGYKISALEIEREILENSEVAEVAVVGVPNDEFGQVIGAIIATKSGDPMSLEDLQSWCAERLAKYKQPRICINVDTIPRNAMGKVNKKELVKMFLD